MQGIAPHFVTPWSNIFVPRYECCNKFPKFLGCFSLLIISTLSSNLAYRSLVLSKSIRLRKRLNTLGFKGFRVWTKTSSCFFSLVTFSRNLLGSKFCKIWNLDSMISSSHPLFISQLRNS